MPLFLDALSNHVPIPSAPVVDDGGRNEKEEQEVVGGAPTKSFGPKHTHTQAKTEKRHLPLGVMRFVLCLVLIMVVFVLLAVMNVVRERAECRLREKGLWPAAELAQENRAGGIIATSSAATTSEQKPKGMKSFLKWKSASSFQ